MNQSFFNRLFLSRLISHIFPVLFVTLMSLSILTGCAKQDTNAAQAPSDTSSAALSELPTITDASVMPEFTTTDLYDNTVTNDIFAQKDLTVVNVWGTFCSPCIGEMPELGEWVKEMPENVQLIGIVADIADANDTEHIELAKEILASANADFMQLLPCEDFAPIFHDIVGVPTTFFVDSEGNIVGEPIVGAYVDGYKAFVEEYLNESEN